jgi:hypothetical protein
MCRDGMGDHGGEIRKRQNLLQKVRAFFRVSSAHAVSTIRLVRFLQAMAADQQVSHTRTLTVGETFQRRADGDTAVPFIRLSGKWLADAGFRVGDSIRVSVTKERLAINHCMNTGHKSQQNTPTRT